MSHYASYVTHGSVRGGCGHDHRSQRTAEECLRRDQRGCAGQGGYSDRRVIEQRTCLTPSCRRAKYKIECRECGRWFCHHIIGHIVRPVPDSNRGAKGCCASNACLVAGYQRFQDKLREAEGDK